MTNEDLAAFRQMLVDLRKKLAHNVSHMQDEALRSGGENGADLSDVPMEHLADHGTDNFARDLMIGVLQNSEAELNDIDWALTRIDDGTFGTCEDCGEEISRGRLKALPFAHRCIQCKHLAEQEAAENEGG